MTWQASAIVVGGLLRAAEAAGGNGAVIAKGDPGAGALLVIVASRGRPSAMLERVSSIEYGFTWNNLESDDLLDSQRVARLIDEKKRFDRDIWIVELDVADPSRFIADTLG